MEPKLQCLGVQCSVWPIQTPWLPSDFALSHSGALLHRRAAWRSEVHWPGCCIWRLGSANGLLDFKISWIGQTIFPRWILAEIFLFRHIKQTYSYISSLAGAPCAHMSNNLCLSGWCCYGMVKHRSEDVCWMFGLANEIIRACEWVRSMKLSGWNAERRLGLVRLLLLPCIIRSLRRLICKCWLLHLLIENVIKCDFVIATIYNLKI